MDASNISGILRRLLFEHDLKVTDLAKLTKVPQPTLQRLVAGTSARPHEKSLAPIAQYFDISLEQLRGEVPIPSLDRTNETLEELGVHRIPILSWLEVEDWLAERSSRENEYPTVLTDTPVSSISFALKLEDASMEPLFSIGTTVILDPSKEAKDRYYVLVKLKAHHKPIFRQLFIDAGDQFIKALSPHLESSRIHLLEDDDRILGVLIEAKQQYA
jgi:SOS-response transcriptional repressor LexA